MIINHNMASLNTLNSLNANNTTMQKSLAKLSSGLRINTAADDAAGLAISEKMRGQISGLDQASANAQDGISLLQTAEGALDETTSILQRMRELSVQAASDSLTDSDRTDIQSEFDELIDEIDRIAQTTQFNTKNLLDGSMSKSTAAVANVSSNSSLATSSVGTGANITSDAITLDSASQSITGTALSDTDAAAVDSVSFTLTVNGTEHTITADTSGSSTTAGHITAIQAAVDAAVGAGVVAIGGDTGGITIAADTGSTATSIAVAGASEINIADTEISAEISSSTTLTQLATIAGTTEGASGTSFTISDGTTTATVSVAAGATLSALADAVEATGLATLTIDTTTNTISLTSVATGSTASITATDVASSGTFAATLLANTATAGTDAAAFSLSTKLTDLADTGTNNLGITASDTITINYVQNGAMAAKSIAVTATTTLADINTALEGVATVSLNSTTGALSVTADTAGSAGAVYGLTFTVTDSAGEENETASSAMSSWSQTTAASDKRANGSATVLIGANTGQTLNLSISSMDASSLGVKNLSVGSQREADVAISVIDTATSMVSAARGKMGAEENRLEHTINNLTTSSENITSAESRIRDVDMAAEMAEYTKLSVINQAATAMLAQANQQPEQVLSLLQ